MPCIGSLYHSQASQSRVVPIEILGRLAQHAQVVSALGAPQAHPTRVLHEAAAAVSLIAPKRSCRRLRRRPAGRISGTVGDAGQGRAAPQFGGGEDGRGRGGGEEARGEAVDRLRPTAQAVPAG